MLKDDNQKTTDVRLPNNEEQIQTQDLEFSTIGRNRDRDRDSDRSCDDCSHSHWEDVQEIKSESFKF